MNPYGHSKRMSEQMIQDFAATGAIRYVTLRYFNVAGADPAGRSGQRLASATNLIKIACDAALGLRESVTIYGSDYETEDGTGVRDYIHVEDLAAAHIDALSYLWWGGDSATLNCGYGRGYSVREVLDATQRIARVSFQIIEARRRAGDPACVIADSRAIRSKLEWKPRFAELDTIISTALAWEKKRSASLAPVSHDLILDAKATALPASLFAPKNTH
jgi:UDP-glucose 4-epimerase